MKKLLCVILAVSLLLLNACGFSKNSNIVFYYPRVSYLYNRDDGVIDFEKKQSSLRDYSLDELIVFYLEGPSDTQFYCPLSGDVQLIETREDKNGLHITFSSELSDLSATELTLGLAALSKTLFQVTEAESICIHAEETLLDGEQKIVFKRDNIYLWDSFTDQVPTTQTTGETQ